MLYDSRNVFPQLGPTDFRVWDGVLQVHVVFLNEHIHSVICSQCRPSTFLYISIMVQNIVSNIIACQGKLRFQKDRLQRACVAAVALYECSSLYT